MNETSKGQKTRERIVAEAANLFNRRGFEGSSMSDVMAATGLEKGGIYRHFSSKEELAAEAFDYAWKSAFETRIHDLEQVPNSIEKLKRFIVNFINGRPAVSGGCPVLNTAVEADDGNLLLRDRVRAAWREWRDYLAEIIAAGLKRKEIRPEVDAKQVATLIISSLEGALMITRLERNKEALLTAQSHLERYLETLRLHSRRAEPR
jgi:TetR/AcrR family transcriptional regulator, transcriptional repressor for nem operon